MIRTGQKLAIYVPEGKKTKAEKTTVKTEQVTQVSAVPDSSSTHAEFEYYTVKRGDTPNEIAKQFGIEAGELMSINGISSERGLQIGQKLKVRKKI